MPERLRSVLFAPAVRPDLAAKLPLSGADLVVLDCEDGSPPDSKDLARTEAMASVALLREHAPAQAVAIRVNPVHSHHFVADIEAAAAAGPDVVVVPKIETSDEVARTLEVLDGGDSNPVVMAGLETVAGVVGCHEVLAAEGVGAAYFGAEDYVADLGGVRRSDNLEVLVPRTVVAQAARLAGVPVVDQIVAAFADLERFAAEAAVARSLGYAGKLCIHPGQVSVAHEAFAPNAADVERARRMLEAAGEFGGERMGVVVVDGQMVDEPLLRQARAVLAAVEER